MAENSGSAADILKGLLGDDAGEKIKTLFGSGQDSGTNDVQSAAQDNPVETESTRPIQTGGGNDYSDRIKGLLNELSRPNDPRSQLLLSLKPYMSENRKRSIDNAVKLLNISKISGMFK